MNRTIGLVGALLAGSGAAVLHFAALEKAQTETRVATIGYAILKKDYAAGEALEFTRETAPQLFKQLDIPKTTNVPAVKISDLNTVMGLRASRPLKAGELLLLQDIAPPDPSLLLRKGERALLVSLSDVAVEPKLLRVGAEVGFVVELTPPEEASGPAGNQGGSDRRKGDLGEIGPFRIVSVGDQVADGVRGSSQTIGVAVTVDEGGRLSEAGATLLESDSNRRLRAVTLFGR